MPPLIEKAKWAKQAIDDKANVVEIDDAADVDQDEGNGDGEEKRYVEPDFSFEPYFDEQGCNGDPVLLGIDQTSDSHCGSDDTRAGEGAGAAYTDTGTPFCTPLDATPGPINLQLGDEGLQAFASTPRTAPLPSARASRQFRSSGLKKPAKTNNPVATLTEAVTTAKATKLPAARGYKLGSRDEQEAYVHKSLRSASNRLGGSKLYAFRDSVGSKRARDDKDNDQVEASFAKAKRIRAQKTTKALQQKLADLEGNSSNLGSSAFEMMLLFRERNERKAEDRRVEEDLRRRDEAAAKEVRLIVDKVEMEERRRQDKIDMDERLRRDKEDARAPKSCCC
uniref:Uncharacterized protein n=1 Tax=Phytophthora ramorum TaxID=164328 RepID=H3GRG6_PHYRM